MPQSTRSTTGNGAAFTAPPRDAVATSERLTLRRFDERDAAFIVELLNEPSWIRYIGDKDVKTQEDAVRYLQNGPLAMYDREGFGLYLVEFRATGEPLGMCGLIRREGLKDVDVGFAFLPRFWGRGYAREATRAIMDYGRSVLGLSRIVAICSRDNDRSRRLLQKLGFRFEGTIALAGGTEELELHAVGR